MKTKFLCYSIFILVILAVTMSFVSATSNETNDNLTLDNAEIKSFESIQVEVNKAKENENLLKVFRLKLTRLRKMMLLIWKVIIKVPEKKFQFLNL